MQEVLFDACGEVERQGKVVVVGEGPEHSSPTTYGVLGALVRLNLGGESALPNGAIYMSWVARAVAPDCGFVRTKYRSGCCGCLAAKQPELLSG